MIDALRTWLTRWQEFLGWLPLAFVLALAAWLVLGALVPHDTSTALSALIELTILVAHAFAAAALTRLLWRRWRQPLTDDEQAAYWAALMEGSRGAVVVFLGNLVFWLCALALLLWFFSPAR